MNLIRSGAGFIANSWLFKRGQSLWRENEQDWNKPLGKGGKLLCGSYLILSDYSTGRFPPKFLDQQKAYDAEIEYQYSLPGTTIEKVKATNMRKPFWYGSAVRNYLQSFSAVAESFETIGIQPPAKLLELGCGGGWMAEFMALMGYDVLGTTISQHEIDDASLRIASLRAKKLNSRLAFLATPMEEAHKACGDRGPFDAVYVFEALHHAYDWKKACVAAYHSLKPGGWFFLCSEPNVIHTFIAYRIGRLSNTHEIGFRRSVLIRGLKEAGFSKILILRNRFGYLVKQHWLAAQKAP